MASRFTALTSAALTSVLLTVAGLVFTSTAAQAADQVVLKYGVLERSIAVSDLEAFAETGELARPLQRYIRISGEQPERIRQTLTREFTISPRLLDRLLNNPIGEAALDQLSQAIYPPSGSADPAALRSALVLSASDDDRISILEVVRNYPTPQVYIDGERVVQAYNQLRDLSDRLAPILEGIGI
ncbi:alpha/beta hydrolase [Microcoleus sp. FACHB-1515]|uniref:alpha/beta hydrolase n=1 Tax=Cyanophyceae TaxID=3028117 RepID=UPI001682F9BC|nr:alpha/beta hydrolase [Microcoleus sp. FACHB-1515]MBD2089418.1 alpha/beta hydrolase [Microcoleus sp. FACHB-1515]